MRNILFFTLLLLTASCQSKRKEYDPPTIDESILQEGDLAFRRGYSVSSRVVLAADKAGTYSHVGIIVRDSAGWRVVHAVPGETDEEYPEERIKKETLSQFYKPDRAMWGAIFRIDTTAQIKAIAAKKAEELYRKRLLFDHDYNPEDSSKMYCTELLYFVYGVAGIDITEGRRTSYPGFRRDFILPKDLTDNKLMKQIFFYSLSSQDSIK